MRSTLRERLYARLAPCADPACECANCLLWTGCGNGKGYGLIWDCGRMKKVHRVAWELENGPVPDGLDLDHVHARGCRHRDCANTAHLEPVTRRENLMRGNTFPARNAAKTHCDYGHEFTPENTRIYRGRRNCRTCSRAWQRAHKLPAVTP